MIFDKNEKDEDVFVPIKEIKTKKMTLKNMKPKKYSRIFMKKLFLSPSLLTT